MGPKCLEPSGFGAEHGGKPLPTDLKPRAPKPLNPAPWKAAQTCSGLGEVLVILALDLSFAAVSLRFAWSVRLFL